jgi:IS5 family transposase
LDDLWVQGRATGQRELLDVDSVAGHLLKPGSGFAFLAMHRRELFPDEMFADLFPTGRGRPSVPADVMASVITLQALHGLSDAETVDAVTYDLRWKAACGLPVTAVAFHATTLTYWRRRLARSGRPNRIFEAVKLVVAETGVLTGKTRRALDSTILDDAVATQDTVTQLIAAIRRVRRDVAGAAEVIAGQCNAHDYDEAGKPVIAWDDEQARAELVDALVSDAHRLLGHLPEQELGPKAAESVALLALIAGQDVEPAGGSDGTDGRWRIAQKVAPDRVISVIDPDSRHAHKTRTHHQDGFKAHVAVEPETGIFTAGRLTKASGPDTSDGALADELLAEENAPCDVLGDTAYGSVETRSTLLDADHRTFIKPMPVPTVIAGGFTYDDFDIDPRAGTATCPAGHTRRIPNSRRVNFAVHCRDCPVRARCTTSPHGRWITVHPRDDLLRAARRQAETVEFQQTYRQHRPMVERGIAWLTRAGNRRVRYRGVANNDQWLQHRMAALNLRRMITLGLGRREGVWAVS